MNKLSRKELVKRILESCGESDWSAEELVAISLKYMKKDAIQKLYTNHHSSWFEDE